MSPARTRRWLWLWGTGYVVLVGSLVWALVSARNWALTELATPKSARQWQDWREDVRRQQSRPVPVRRRVPKSDEPPALVLMRDNFAISLIGAMVLCSVLYLVIAWFITGIFTGPATTDQASR